MPAILTDRGHLSENANLINVIVVSIELITALNSLDNAPPNSLKKPLDISLIQNSNLF
jgi:hypothetical protein